MNGKGDKRRPMQITHQEYATNYDRIFRAVKAKLDQTVFPDSLRPRKKKGRATFVTQLNITGEQPTAAPCLLCHGTGTLWYPIPGEQKRSLATCEQCKGSGRQTE